MKRSKSLSYQGKKHIPLPTGLYTVGCMDIMTSYSKTGVFVRLYYPTGGSRIRDRYLQWPLWIPHKEYVKGYAIRAGICHRVFRSLKYLFVGDVYIPAIWHAPVAMEQSRYPVVVFSHGLGAWRNTYSTICLELASHGYVVAAVEHRDHSACATFYVKQARMSSYGLHPGSYMTDMEEAFLEEESEWRDVIDGKWEPKSKPQSIGPPTETKEWMFYESIAKEREQLVRSKQLRLRAQECSRALDLLRSLVNGKQIQNVLDPNLSTEMFRNRLDFSKAAVIGHSFGGATVIATLAIDTRFRVGVSLDPWMLPFIQDQSPITIAQQPLLCINTDYFQDENSLQLMRGLQRDDTERRFITIRKSHHRDQCDVPFVSSGCFKVFSGVSCGVNRFAVMDLTTHLTLQFLREHLSVPASDDENDVSIPRKVHMAVKTFS